MSLSIFEKAIQQDLERFFHEDDLSRHHTYLTNLPKDLVTCQLKIKSDLVLCGMPYLVSAFRFLGATLDFSLAEKWEGKKMTKGEIIEWQLPFDVALTGERVALNLLQHASAIATLAREFQTIVHSKKLSVTLLDTRKTTPGLRSLEKYAVEVGGCFNHRFGQADAWMIKDNHKTFFGSLAKAIDFFERQHSYYIPLIAEIHSLEELSVAIERNVKHVLLDNFTHDQVVSAVKIKPQGMTYEISGGVKINNIHDYLIEGIDAISIGALTHSAPHVDISMKMKRI